jgi:serine/threonine-protein kinase
LIGTGIKLAGEQPHLLAYSAYAHALAGEAEQAEKILEGLEKFSRRTQLLFTDLALVNAALGRIDAGLDALERAHSEREYLVATLPVHPVFDPFRDEPRFHAMLKELSLAGSDDFLADER